MYKPISTMNQKGCCRTCLSKDEEMRNIHIVISVAGDDVKISDILQLFYNYKVSDDDELPQDICITCIQQLVLTYSFKTLIETTRKTLIENIENNLEDLSHDQSESEKEAHEYPTPYIKNQYAQLLNKELNLFCAQCKENFRNKVNLYRHCLKEHPSKNETGRECEFCNERFEDFRSLVIHRKLHFAPHLCEICWKTFFTLEEINTHYCEKPIEIQEKSKEGERVLRQCDQCGKSYPQGYIKMHMLIHGEKRPYSCKYCPKKFKVPCGLNSHVLWNHKRTKNHKCEICNAVFVSASSRSSHVRKHHLKEKKYSCDTCGKSFFSKSEIQRHSLTHTGVKNFHCSICDKSYQTRYGLNTHVKTHQMPVNLLHL